MIYKPYHEQQHQYDDDGTLTTLSVASPDDILRTPGMDAHAPLPTSGFFAIECTGRKITVDKRVLKKGQCAMLQNGTTIQIASYYFYFLLPDNKNNNKAPVTMKVSVMTMTPAIKFEQINSKSTVIAGKSKTSDVHYQSDQNDDDSTVLPPSPKKARTGADEDEDEEEESYLIQSSASPRSSLFNDKQSDSELLRMLSERVIEAAAWDHESQKLGSTLAVRACRAAAKSRTIQQVAREKGGVTQRDIMDWMNDRNGDSVFVEFETMMLTNITKKSLMMSMGKAIVRAGYQRNELVTGRAFRWNLPKDGMSVEDVKHGESAWDDGREGMGLGEETEG